MLMLARSRWLALLLLGFSSGLPFYATSKTLQAWLSAERIDLAALGALSLVALPYGLKFLWAPLLDRYSLPWLGRRRGILLVTQVLLSASLAALALSQPSRGLLYVVITALLVAFLSASQDLAFDAWRVEVVAHEQCGTAAAVSVFGYRAALLCMGSLSLVLAEVVSWRTIYFGAAALQLLFCLVTWWAPDSPPHHPSSSYRDTQKKGQGASAPSAALHEKPSANEEGNEGNEDTHKKGSATAVVARRPASLREAVVLPVVEFVGRRGWRHAAVLLLFVVLFKWGVHWVAAMALPFLLALGFGQAQVGVVLGGAGMAATLAGTAAGGALMASLSVMRALWVFGALQSLCGLAFWQLARLGAEPTWMVIAVVGEHFFVGMGTAALVGFLVDACDRRFAATQFAVLSSLMALGRDGLSAPAGYVAQRLGWPNFFLLTVAAGLPGLVLLWLLGRLLQGAAPSARKVRA